MREPATTAAWMAWDDEQDQQDIRQRALHARTEDEHLDVLREAGSLRAGIALLATGRPPQLTLTNQIVLAQCRIQEAERLRRQAEAPVSEANRIRYAEHYRIVQSRLTAFRALGDGPARSEEWRLARGAFGGITHDYEAAVRAELAARKEQAT